MTRENQRFSTFAPFEHGYEIPVAVDTTVDTGRKQPFLTKTIGYMDTGVSH